MIQDILGYFVRPEHLYQTWVQDMNAGNFEVQKVADSLNQFERSIAVTNGSDDFKGLFSSCYQELYRLDPVLNLKKRPLKSSEPLVTAMLRSNWLRLSATF